MENHSFRIHTNKQWFWFGVKWSAFQPCVDGPRLARIILTLMQSWLVLPCVRPVCAALLLVRWP